MSVSKRFPADTRLQEKTFLNNDEINGELYALLQSCSMPVAQPDGSIITKVFKKDLPKQADMCKKLGIGSPKTLRTKMKLLESRGFVLKEEDGNYILPEREDMFLMIPLETLQFINNNCKEHIMKIYIYLGQRYKFALSKGQPYEFTSEELGEHCGIKVKNNSRGYQIINDALTLLVNNGLIDYVSFFNGVTQKKKLTNFSFEYKDEKKG